MTTTTPNDNVHVGFVALIGRPSTGKSTFLNTLLHQSVAIVSATPQSTRQRIRGIYNSEHAQIIFTDTPGIHHSERRFNQHLLNQAKLGIEEADAVLYLIDVTRKPGEEEAFIISLYKIFISLFGLHSIKLISESPPSQLNISYSSTSSFRVCLFIRYPLKRIWALQN